MPSTRTIHLICNAHIDPVWLWEWEEGAAAAIGTFRAAADLCEEFDGFVFNHNEAILYRWVEEYEPALFERIRALVAQGKWHIMGGWYLEPDCNMPSGESFVRQILLGRRYFADRFAARPTTATNLDPFGHTRGLVQIMAKSGYDSYLFCRPAQDTCALEKDEFIWEGYDGSRVLATRPFAHYSSLLGMARQKVEWLLKERPDTPVAALLWGVGDHGGGPSRADLQALADLMQTTPEADVRHSTPEAYFAQLQAQADALPIHRRDLNPWAVGCYTSQVRVKQAHRRLENELYATEKMATAAWGRGLMDYPQTEFQEAMRDLATSEFHDILPGSAIQPVEEMALRLMDHGLEILSRVKARAFFALAQGQPKPAEAEIPILVYNPHPFLVKGIVECEFSLPDFNLDGTFTQATAYRDGQPLPTQMEKEQSHLELDWRKRIAFAAELAPAQMNRFDCRLTRIPRKPAPALQAEDGAIHFQTADVEVVINTQTGLLDRYRVGGVDYVGPNSCRLLVLHDDPDPWGMRVRAFRNVAGTFELLSPQESQRFSGVENPSLPAVRVIEDGAVRVVVEAVLGYGNSTICQRYKLPRQGSEIELEIRVHWNEKDCMLKLALPTPDREAEYLGQVAYGVEPLPTNGDEVVAHKWVAVVSRTRNAALSVINDGTYGSDLCDGELRLSLLRSPAYSAHPIGDYLRMPQDRYSPRIDQGERCFRFWLNGGPVDERLQAVDREALVHNEKPMALSFFPAGGGQTPGPFITLSDGVVQLTTLKKAEDGDGLILRLFEPTGQARTTLVSLPWAGLQQEVALHGFEVRTLRVDVEKRTWTDVNLVEEET